MYLGRMIDMEGDWCHWLYRAVPVRRTRTVALVDDWKLDKRKEERESGRNVWCLLLFDGSNYYRENVTSKKNTIRIRQWFQNKGRWDFVQLRWYRRPSWVTRSQSKAKLLGRMATDAWCTADQMPILQLNFKQTNKKKFVKNLLKNCLKNKNYESNLKWGKWCCWWWVVWMMGVTQTNYGHVLPVRALPCCLHLA